MNKKILSVAVSLVLMFSLVLGVTGNTVVASADKQNAELSNISYAKGPFDLSIARLEKIEEMLRKSGKISKDASKEEADKIVKDFLRNKLNNMPKQKGVLDDKKAKVDEIVQATIDELSNDTSETNSLVSETYTGTVKTDKILSILMEYPDYPHNSILPGETDLYYTDYPTTHFQEMLFGADGYVGPSGQNLISMRQYYEQQSGGSYTVMGQISGWYLAQENAAYYGANDTSGNDVNPRALVVEALAKVAQDPNINLADYDVTDANDLDGDGNYNEPDGIIDHLMIFHSGVGEEAGGGALGEDAIWSHSWSLAAVTQIPGTAYSAYDYTIQPEDGAAGVCAHEYGHDIGLPDEYDTQYTGKGEPVGFWSIMSSGSWGGLLAGTEPTGFSPYCKEYFQARYGGNWLTGAVADLETDLTGTYQTYVLDQASSKGTNNDYVRINLPKKETVVNVPYDGQYEYFSTKGDNLNTAMTLSGIAVSGRRPQLTFNTWYSIEKDWDYAYVQVRETGTTAWTNISGTITTTKDPNLQNLGNGITGASNGWISASFNLGSYSGKTIDVRFNYVTDVAVAEAGFYVDNIKVVDGRTVLYTDNADASNAALAGFEISNGILLTNQYYLVEWRAHAGVDIALAHIMRGSSIMKYEPGLVVWYVDESYTDNWVGLHPGEGFVGVVDADQNVLVWSDNTVASTGYQIHDASFKMTPSEPMFLDLTDTTVNATLTDNITTAVPLFNDSFTYITTEIPDAGKILPNFGLKINVVAQSDDMSTATITVGTVLP